MTSLSISPEFYQGPLEKLFSDEVTLIDVRAPKEFAEGAFPNAINLPILSNEQRHQIGICYKEKGQESAITLGHQLVSGIDRSNKLDLWLNEIERLDSAIYLYCFRGGLRSQISQQWIKEAGKKILIIDGGYKRLRNFLLGNIEQQVEKNSFLVITGNTGSGKTYLLDRLSKDGHKAIDLEGIANHRGSVFGSNLSPQPTQIDFENKLSIQFFKEMNQKGNSILLEDEGQKIGHRVLPQKLIYKKNQSPIFVYTKSLEERVALILKDYCIERWKNVEAQEDAYQSFFLLFKNSFDQIQKRLGVSLYQDCLKIVKDAIEIQEQTGSFNRHQDWISKLLVQYYDPFYEASLNQKKEFIIGSGDESALRDFLKK
jgi:tRNA 2-selenouridine synthase